MGTHIVNGEFQSDKYPTCPPGKVPLSVKDVMAQDLLWEYAQRRRAVDAEFSGDLETALKAAGFGPSRPIDSVVAEAAVVAAATLWRECDTSQSGDRGVACGCLDRLADAVDALGQHDTTGKHGAGGFR